MLLLCVQAQILGDKDPEQEDKDQLAESKNLTMRIDLLINTNTPRDPDKAKYMDTMKDHLVRK